MLDNKLWTFKDGFLEWAYQTYKVKKGTRDDMQRALLWVLDKGGNLIIAPEMQDSKLKKHGDLSPGATPVDRPFAPSRPEQATCCCKEDVDQCAYRKTGTKCCKWRIGEGCPALSRYIEETKKDNFAYSLCGDDLRPKLMSMAHDGGGMGNGDAEKYSAGDFRGLARAGGEIRFPDEVGAKAWVHDKSGYSLQRVDAGPLRNADGTYSAEAMASAIDQTDLGTCGMGRLREYWSAALTAGSANGGIPGLGWSDVSSLRFVAYSWPLEAEGSEK